MRLVAERRSARREWVPGRPDSDRSVATTPSSGGRLTGKIVDRTSAAVDHPERLQPALSVALAWQPRASRPALAALFALDRRLASALAPAREPLLSQVRLAWWRERLQEPASARPKGEPLLAMIGAHWRNCGCELVALVDGWEHMIGPPPHPAGDVNGLAAGRGQALAAFAGLVGAGDDAAAASAAGEAWAQAEFTPSAGSLPPACLPVTARRLRGVAVLGGLARRALAREEPLMHGRAGALAAIRLGMFGG